MKWAAEIAGGAARREISLCHCTSHRAATVATVAATTAYNDATPVAALATFPPPHCFDGGTSSLYAQYESDLNRNVPSVCISILTIRSAQYTDIADYRQCCDSFTLLVVAGGADPGVPPHQGHPQQARRLHCLLAPRLHLRQVKRSTLVCRLCVILVIRCHKTCDNICVPGVPAS